jgi:hypothetical protein
VAVRVRLRTTPQWTLTFADEDDNKNAGGGGGDSECLQVSTEKNFDSFRIGKYSTSFLSLSLCRTMTRTKIFSVCLDRLANKKKMDKEEEEEEARRSWCAIITCLAYSAATKSAR